MLESITPGETYISPSGIRFKVHFIAHHGQDCSIPMVVYENLQDTKDYSAGTTWVICESIFIKTFSES